MSLRDIPFAITRPHVATVAIFIRADYICSWGQEERFNYANYNLSPVRVRQLLQLK
jgi:hypothetical protein